MLGWFVVREDDGQQPEATTEELIEKYEKKSSSAAAAPPAAARGRAPAAAPTPPPAPAVKLNTSVPKIVAGSTPTSSVFAQVYRSAEIDDAEQERVRRR